MEAEYHSELTIAKSIAREAGDIMRRYFDGDQQRQIKADGSPVTIADTMINRLVIERLSAELPDDGVIGEEESTTEYGLGRKWFCDPIDGTKAFTWGVPTAMFSLGLVVDGHPVLGVCYEPMLDKLYWAVRGQGAYCSDSPIHVNDQTLQTGILSTMCSQYRLRHGAPYMDTLLDKRISLAAFSGAVASCMRVAEGRFVGYIEELLNAHDVAAAEVIVTEAGGSICGIDGSTLDYTRPFKGAIVNNGATHDELVKIVNTTTT